MIVLAFVFLGIIIFVQILSIPFRRKNRNFQDDNPNQIQEQERAKTNSWFLR
jgi:preprotein translocase subunit SecG